MSSILKDYEFSFLDLQHLKYNSNPLWLRQETDPDFADKSRINFSVQTKCTDTSVKFENSNLL